MALLTAVDDVQGQYQATLVGEGPCPFQRLGYESLCAIELLHTHPAVGCIARHCRRAGAPLYNVGPCAVLVLVGMGDLNSVSLELNSWRETIFTDPVLDEVAVAPPQPEATPAQIRSWLVGQDGDVPLLRRLLFSVRLELGRLLLFLAQFAYLRLSLPRCRATIALACLAPTGASCALGARSVSGMAACAPTKKEIICPVQSCLISSFA